MALAGATAVNEAEALLASELHVVPPQRFSSLSSQAIVKTVLPEVLRKDVPSIHVAVGGTLMVRSAVLAITEALFRLVVIVAVETRPRHIAGFEVNLSFQLMPILVELLDEKRSQFVVRAKPKLDLDFVNNLGHRKLSRERGWSTCLREILEYLAIILANQH